MIAQATQYENPGVYWGVPMEVYNAIHAVRRSALHELGTSCPADYKYSAEHFDPSDAMKLGSAAHAAILEPETFEQRFVSEPFRPHKARKFDDFEKGSVTLATYNAWVSEQDGKEILKAEDLEKAREIAETARTWKTVRALLREGKAEVTIVWEDPVTRLLCKTRPDFADFDRRLIVDVKTTAKFSDRDFERSVVKTGIDLQMAMIEEGCRVLGMDLPTSFVLVWVRTTGRVANSARYCTAEVMNRGARKYREYLDLYAECLATDTWPDFPSDIRPQHLPKNVR